MTTIMAIVIIANFKRTIRNTNVEQVDLKDFLWVLSNSVKHVKFGDDSKEDTRNNNVADDADEPPVGLPTCEECFNRLNNAQLDLIIYIPNVALRDVETVEEVCEYL